MTQTVETKIAELGTLMTELRKLNDESGSATKARQAELDVAMKKINDRIDEIETKSARSPIVGPEEILEEGLGETKAERAKHRAEVKAFAKWMRHDTKGLSPEDTKALTSDTDTQGGYLVPHVLANTIIELLVQVSPIRDLAAVQTISTGDTLEIPEENGAFSVGWTGERATPTTTTAGTFQFKKVPVHEQYAMPALTQKLLDDSAFNVEAWISKKLGQQLGKDEGAQFVNGTGVNQPEGIITRAGKPAFPAANLVLSGASGAVAMDGLLDTMAALPEYYAQNATFLMKRATKFAVRKLKTSQGVYLWEASFQKGTPPTFDGHYVREAIDMPAVSANNLAVAFADWKEAYQIVDRKQMYVLRDPFTAKPTILFYTRRRLGGQVVKDEAIVFNKISP